MKLNGIHGTFSEAEYLVRQAREMAMAGDHNSAINYLKKAITSESTVFRSIYTAW